MPVSSTEIIARLQLQGSQFSAETQRIFGAMEAQSRDAASRVKSVFEESFTNIQSIAGKALAMPRMKGGSFDLDVKGAREAAAALDAEAAALRQVAAAAEAVALKQNDLSENTRVYLQAARAAAIEAENMARSAHQEAAALDLLQQELMQTQSATELVIQSNRLLNASQDQGVRAARGHGMAMMQAGQQAQDFIIQVGAGQSVIMAFAMQASQAAFVLQGVGGQAGKLAAFMSSGWGTAVLAGITVLSLFWDKMIDTGDAVEKATAELRKNAQQTLVTEEAQKRFANTAEGVADAIRKQRDEQERAGKTMEEAEEQALRSAEAERVKQIEIRKGTLALLEMAKAAAMNARITTYGAGGGASANQARQQMDDTVAELERRAAAAQKAVELAEKTVRGAQRPIIDRRVEETMDAEAAAAGRLRRALRELEQQYDRGGMSKDRYEARRTKLQADHDAEVKRIQEAEARKRREDRAAERQAERTMQLMSPVDGPISSGYGQRSRPRLTNGGRGSANHPALDYAVPTGTGVRAGAAGIVVYTGQMGGYGNVVIVDYGRGTFGQFAHLSEILAKPGDKVAAGDVVARTGATGNVTGAHLDYRVRTGARFDGERLVGGQYVDPRSRVKVGDIGDAQANFDDQRARQIEDQREALQKLITASEQQLSVEAESLRFLGLRVRGMDELATAETEIAQKRRDYAQQMADLSAADRAAQERETEGLRAQLDVFQQQADAYASLITAAGDQTALTAEQKAALDSANDSMLAQLEAARALATTAKDRLLIEEAIARVQSRVTTARGKGDENARDAKRTADEAERLQKRAEQEAFQRQQENISTLASFYYNAFRSGGRSIVEDFRDEMFGVIAEVAARWTLALLSGQKTSLSSILSDMGATSGAGGMGGGLLGALGMFGNKADWSMSAKGSVDALGLGGLGLAPKAGGLGGLSGALSSAMPYLAIASVALPLVSNLFGSVFKSTKWGSASIGLENGIVTGGTGFGNKDSTRSGASGAAGSVAEGVNRLAEQLGATISSIPGLTIGSWDGKARVALTNTSKPLHYNNFGHSMLKDFGEGGEQEAMEYAIKYAFTNAVIDGISQASKNIIARSGDDVEKAMEKVMRIEDVPKRLAAIVDPVGYAIDQFNKDWQKTIDALKEGGASAEEMAQAQRLYQLELERTKASAREASADLKDFLKDLGFGNSSPYSIRDQEAMARASLQPFLDKIDAGQNVDQGQYIDAAQRWLEIERQLEGSTSKYFEAMDLIQSYTNKAISTIDNAKPIRTEVDPFVQATAANTQTSAELLSQVSDQLRDMNGLLGQIAGGGSSSDFFSNARNFQKAYGGI